MKLGLLTAALGELTLEQVAEWASQNGYAALEIACWPAAGGDARRYAGVCHVDVERLDAEAVRRTMDRHGLEISALAYYPNNLDPDREARAATHAHLRRVIDAARALDVRVVGTFVGRDHTRSLAESLDDFRAVFPDLVRYAGERDVAIAIENCPMIFSDDEWPGGKNVAYAPAIWREMFAAIPDANFGLNLDPSHLHWLHIDPERCVRDFADRLLHVHAKDMEIDRDGLYEHGVLSAGMGWQVPRLPGLGEVRFDRFIAALYRAGYDHVISVEHEDRGFEGDLERVLRGFEIARGALAPYIA